MKLQIASAFLASVAFSGAQDPPPMLKIVREDMKPGKSAAHEKIEAAYAHAFAPTKFANYVGWESLSGPTQAWFVEGFADYAGLQAASKIANTEPLKTTLDQLEIQDSELRTGERTMIAHFMKNLSYAPNGFNLAKARYVWVDLVTLRPGYVREFAEWHKIEHAAYQKAGEKMTEAVYVISEGAQVPTYLVAWPMESLKSLDEDAEVKWNSPEAMGDGYERHRQLSKDIFISREHILFAVNPKMSNPPKSYVDADPAFWTPK